MRKRVLSLALCIIVVVCLLPVTAFAATTIESADATISHPVHGATPDTAPQVYGGSCQIDTSCNSDGYTNGVRWREFSTGKVMGSSDTFVGGKNYELSVCLLAKSGYAFASGKSRVTVNAEAASLSVQDVSHARATVTLTADNLYISSVNVTGLDTPQNGSTPDYTVSVSESTCQTDSTITRDTVKNGVAWIDLTSNTYMKPTDKFQGGRKYCVEVYLIANPGYEFPTNTQVYLDGTAVTASKSGQTIFATLQFPAVSEHIHTPSDWRTTQVYHYTVCTTCGDMLKQDDHTGGKATCLEPGLCSVCGYAYLETTEDHVPESKWTARAEMYHYHKCKLCGAHCDIEDHRWSPKHHAVDARGHAYQCADCKGYDTIVPHTPGPEATATTPQTCTVCGYIITPAKNHVHDLAKIPAVEATCMEGGNIEYYVCSGCMDCFTDPEGKNKIPETMSVMTDPLGHTVSDDWKSDENLHWRTCTACGETLAETEMRHEMKKNKCTTCGYKESAKADKDDEEEEKDDPPEQDSELPVGVLITVAASVVIFAAAIVATVIVLKKKK